jgi:hypothetical protein
VEGESTLESTTRFGAAPISTRKPPAVIAGLTRIAEISKSAARIDIPIPRRKKIEKDLSTFGCRQSSSIVALIFILPPNSQVHKINSIFSRNYRSASEKRINENGGYL